MSQFAGRCFGVHSVGVGQRLRLKGSASKAWNGSGAFKAMFPAGNPIEKNSSEDVTISFYLPLFVVSIKVCVTGHRLLRCCDGMDDLARSLRVETAMLSGMLRREGGL